jgi:hypothetical protein
MFFFHFSHRMSFFIRGWDCYIITMVLIFDGAWPRVKHGFLGVEISQLFAANCDGKLFLPVP